MTIEEKVLKMVDLSGLSEYESSDFAKTYVTVLIQNLVSYVDADITVGPVRCVDSITLEHELSQDITGIPGAYSAVDGDAEPLYRFAEKYSGMSVTAFDDFAKEVILDFLNLHNGLFVVHLSQANICELSLDVPAQGDNKTLKAQKMPGIFVIPVTFSFGPVNFLFGEN